MTIQELAQTVKSTIKEINTFSEPLGDTTNIMKEAIEGRLDKLTPSEIHQGLLHLQENGEIKYDGFTGYVSEINWK